MLRDTDVRHDAEPPPHDHDRAGGSGGGGGGGVSSLGRLQHLESVKCGEEDEEIEPEGDEDVPPGCGNGMRVRWKRGVCRRPVNTNGQ